MIRAYQNTAINTESISTRADYRGNWQLSLSAACGMTSKPTNMKGT